jgi:flagellar basal-body rod modification protein FlgD
MDVTAGTAINQQNRTLTGAQSLASDFSSFLQLLTTQLQNQDPLSPMDSTEFTNQLVQFSAVEQQININSKLDSLVSLGLGNSMSSAIGYVGKDVSYISSEFNFDGTRPIEMNYAYSGAKEAVNSKIRIYNEEGDLVFETNASTNSGKNDFTWDGKDNEGNLVEAGTYEIKIDALDIDGKSVDSTIVVTGNARGIETQNGLIFLLIGERAVSLGNVINVSTPPQTIPGPGPIPINPATSSGGSLQKVIETGRIGRTL